MINLISNYDKVRNRVNTDIRFKHYYSDELFVALELFEQNDRFTFKEVQETSIIFQVAGLGIPCNRDILFCNPLGPRVEVCYYKHVLGSDFQDSSITEILFPEDLPERIIKIYEYLES